jgi:NADH:ubiquinone oxidoreductase subunit E
MRQVEVCMGSSCFLKGAYEVLDALLQAARRHGLEGEVAIAGAFCKEHCREGVSVEIDGVIHSVPNAAQARALFAQVFLPETDASS